MNQTEWLARLKPYAKPNLAKSIFQIVTAFVPYCAILLGMYFLIDRGYPYWTTILPAILAAFFMVRIFIIFHDCVHLSFFKSKIACSIIGHITGIMTFTAYYDWGHEHYIHHGTNSNLDKRGVGDVWMLTVDEYNSMKPGKRLWYRIYRNPIFLFLIAPLVSFVLLSRLPKNYKNRRGVISVILTDIIIAGIIVLVSLTIGIKYYLLIQLPVMFFGSMMGVWLFFLQHNYLEEYWEREKDWDFFKSAMIGSTFYKLPGILRWFTGNIGYHHIHHLKTSIPNYNLKKCYDAIPELREIKPITFFSSFSSMFLKLYDEQAKILVNFTKARRMRTISIRRK
jgi:acyl-lipid omega-6 desaturase (Delta-12 desaturase)